MTFSVNGGSGPIVSDGNLTANTWHHIVATIMASGPLLLYVDGVAQASAGTVITPYNLANTLPFFVGGGDVATYDATFQIDEVAIYNAPLSAPQVLAHYTAGTTIPTGGGQTGTEQMLWSGQSTAQRLKLAEAAARIRGYKVRRS